MREVVVFLMFLAGSVFAQELLLEGRLITGLELGQKSEPLPVLIEIEGSKCVIYAVAKPGGAKRVWIKPQKIYCGKEAKAVKGFVTDEKNVFGLKCRSLPCKLEAGTKVRVFIDENNLGSLLRELFSRFDRKTFSGGDGDAGIWV